MAEQDIVKTIEDWSLGHGLVILKADSNGSSAVHAPVTLKPSQFKKTAFDEALAAQKPYNTLYHNVVKNEKWLESTLEELAIFDCDFSGKLLDIYKRARPQRTQSLTAGLFRSDYIVHSGDGQSQIKQVEFNTVSVSFGALSSRLTELHNFLIESGFYPDICLERVPKSTALYQLSQGLADIDQAYRQQNNVEGTAVLFIVQPGERNALDQRLIEYELFDVHKVKSYRVTLSQVRSLTTKSSKGKLIYDPTKVEISTIYYRSGYGPSDYPSDEEWEARYYLETCHAINTPNVLTQLAGAKKIQQLLSDDKILEELSAGISEQDLTLIKKTFMKIYPMDGSLEGLQARKLALETPEKFVLKPQREGGGNNIYKENIPEFLNGLSKDHWGAYILMELIEPARYSNKILREGEVCDGEIVSELGVFGTVLWDLDSQTCLINDVPGFLLRTKLQSSNEGGVAAGFGCIDSVLLVD